MLEKARKNLKKQKRIQKAASVCKAIASVASFCGPYGAAIGTAINTVSNIASNVAYASGKLGVDADYTRFFPEVADTTYSITKMLNSVKTSIDGISWSSITTDGKYLENQFNAINKTLSPLLNTIGDVRKAFQSNSVTDDEVDAVFQSLCAESPEWIALQADLKSLDIKKKKIQQKLDTIDVSIPKIAADISSGVLSLDAFRRKAIENNSKRDLYAMQYLEKMEQRAKNRLLKYH